MKIDNEVIIVNKLKVNKVSYRNSQYYILNGVDISKYCTKSVTEGVKKAALAEVVKLSPPMFKLRLLDDPYTTAEFVCMFCSSVLEKSIQECTDIVSVINSTGEWEYEKELPYEVCHTIVTFLQNANEQTGNGLRWEITEVQEPYEKIESLVQNLIRRDYPEDNMA